MTRPALFDKLAATLVSTATAPSASYMQRVLLNGMGGGAKWGNGLSASGRQVIINHTEARRNARAAMQESPQARAVVERAADITADGGLRLNLTPDVRVLGITPEAGDAFAQDLMARFHLWALSKNQSRSGNMNFYQSQVLWQLCRNRDNDQFVRLYYDRDDPTLINPLQFELLDPDQIRADAFTSTAGYNEGCDDGIIRDARGRETGYKVFWYNRATQAYEMVTVPRVYPGGRISMLHGFKAEYAGQGRGYSRLAHAIQDLENLTDFSSSVIKKAINQSSIVAFIEPSKDEDTPNNPLESTIGAFGAGPAAQLFGSAPTPVPGVPVNPTTPGVDNFYNLPEATIGTPGSIFLANLTKGSTLKFPQNTAPGDTYDKFVDAFFAYISAACNVPVEVVLMKFGQNYSASRGTLLLFWATVEVERNDMGVEYLNPVVEMWASEEIAAGRIQAPGWQDPRMRAAWLKCKWEGCGVPDIDPARSAKARRDNIEIGVTNGDIEAINLNGTSASANIARNNELYRNYQPLPWNAPQAGGGDPGATVAHAIIEGMRDMLREEMNL